MGTFENMRIAALYDIHGNVDALDAVLVEVETETIDLIVIGGDIAWGAFPSEAVTRVQSLGKKALVLRGNADREVVSPPTTGEPSWIDEVTAWCFGQLSQTQKTYLGDLSPTQTANSRGSGEILFCHGTPRSDEEIFTAITPDEEAEKMLGDVEQEMIVCGHTHTQFDRRIGRHRVVNAGSVGMPYEDDPGAYWAIFGEDVELRRTEYDFEAAAARMRASSCPHAEGFATGITTPPTAREATQRFEDARPRNPEPNTPTGNHAGRRSVQET